MEIFLNSSSVVIKGRCQMGKTRRILTTPRVDAVRHQATHINPSGLAGQRSVGLCQGACRPLSQPNPCLNGDRMPIRASVEPPGGERRPAIQTCLFPPHSSAEKNSLRRIELIRSCRIDTSRSEGNTQSQMNGMNVNKRECSENRLGPEACRTLPLPLPSLTGVVVTSPLAPPSTVQILYPGRSGRRDRADIE